MTAKGTSRKGKVLFAVALFAITLGCIEVYKSALGYEAVLGEAKINLENVVRLIAEQTESTIELTDTLLAEEVARLESTPMDAALRTSINKGLTVAVQNSPRILVVSIFDERGNWLVNSSATAPDLSQNFADRAYFQHHRSDPGKELFIGVPVPRKTTGQWAITLSRRWNKPDGSFGGVVIAAITLDYLQQFFQTLNIGQNGTLSLLRADGILLARRPYVQANVGKNVASGELFTKYLPQAVTGTFRGTSQLDGGDRYFSYSRFTRYPIVATAALSMNEILAPWRRETAWSLGSLAFLLALAVWLAARLERQLQQREQAQERLQQSEYFMASLLDHMPGLVAYWGADLRCIFANRHFQEWFGRSKEQMQGITVQDVLGPELFAQNEPMMRAALRGERQQFERTLNKPNGDVGYLYTQYIPTVEEDGKVRGFLVLAADVTELKQAQVRLERLNAELQHRSTQLEAASLAKSQFLANMSHEIRTPMNAVMGMVQLLEMTALTPQQQDYVGKTQLAAKALLSIINDILDFSKIEAGKLQLEIAPFELDGLLRSLAAILAGSVGSKPVEVLFDVDPQVPSRIAADALRLQQVLLNLVGNAVKFTLKGEVVLALRVLRGDAGEVEIAFSVRDTGIGIDKPQQERIFEGFSQAEVSTTRRFGGTGLGLAISRQLVELMGGRLEVDSTLGQGSVFRFTLVFKAAPMVQPPPGTVLPERARSIAQHPLKVLVVDDNPTARGLLVAMASSFGWQAQAADSGEAALVQVDQSLQGSTPFDVIFMDWFMPGLDGTATTRRIRHMHQAVAMAAPLVILVTAHGQEALQHAAGTPVFDGTLSKPITPSMLFDAVADVGLHVVAATAQAQPVVPADGALSGLRLLLVEDNRMNQQVARELLRSVGAEVTLADNGQVCLDLLQADGAAFDLVLMDVQMPVMDGYAASRAIRANPAWQALPIIAMTANASAADREASRQASMNAHVAKPFDLGELVHIILQTVAQPPQGPAAAVPLDAAAVAQGTLPPQVREHAHAHGMELEAALQRFGGNQPAFARALRTFADSASAMVAQMQAAADGGGDGMAGILHTLKGLAGTMGAQRLQALALTLEARVKHGGRVGVQDLQELTTLLTQQAQASARIAALLVPQQEPASGVVASTPAPMDLFTLSVRLKGLRAQLLASNLGAQALAEGLRQPLAAWAPAAYAQLLQCMGQLDFAAAAQHCTDLIQRCEAPQDGG